MIGAQMAPHNGEWVVTCAEHDWRWQVKTEGHALNLLRKHDREQEHTQAADGTPAALDLTAAAALVTIIHADPIMSDLAKTTARNLWSCLTGLEGEVGLAYAREVAAHQTTAILPPF